MPVYLQTPIGPPSALLLQVQLLGIPPCPLGLLSHQALQGKPDLETTPGLAPPIKPLVQLPWQALIPEWVQRVSDWLPTQS